ncbi:N-acetylmuramate alpha-1-phosphate uridylyltransferase MurU [Oleiagrimonas sp. MCCC 1A03011]|uniref:N-acetylmuramate alpha-1-phosphate uridylyltransferase MurU n=1 Tax=Oleiagrimonas sp. MCCC 1A03011 TaxID=1926883 RepID=UPI000DC4C59C|nr:nucleotidyltransferase family protein [Oleiagrimonas sp. MCCC 1A03011]RAP57503.1 mannose-1-phosphate guanylyltransferase [Oleiagrimonas sp. MCCC 1A03011]
MRALIFAAGLGTRMRPLTDRTPKPLLPVGDKPLIVWHLEKLSALGVREVVINTAHLGAQFPPALGDGTRWGLRIHYAHEGDTPLETGGGMLHALPHLGDAPFLVVNGDVWTDFDFARLPASPRDLAHLVLVDNPPFHPAGDFRLDAEGRMHEEGEPRLTFAGIGLYRPQLLDDWRRVIGDEDGAAMQPPRFALAPLLRAAMREGRIDGQHHVGRWTDVGTPERLRALDAMLRS